MKFSNFAAMISLLIASVATFIGTGSASAGEGYIITLTNKWDAVVDIEVRKNSTDNWQLKGFSQPIVLRKNETKTVYTEACGVWDDCPTYGQPRSRNTSLEFYVRIDGKRRDNVRITYDYLLFRGVNTEATCHTGTWHSGEKPYFQPAFDLKKRGDQYILNVTVAAGKGIVCSTE